jgi:isopenicillin N synthase-like dioxygenase
VAAQITADVIDQLRARYGSVDEVPFERASVLQINSFAEPSQEELLQQPHEDGVFLTVIWTSAPGLEAVLGDGLREMYFPPDQVAVMPGGVMTAMTGGELQPLFHQARHHRILERKSIMYFVSPDADSDITPFVTNEFNRDLDIRQLVVGNPQSYFGLSEDFVTA